MDWMDWIYLRTLLPLEHLAVLINEFLSTYHQEMSGFLFSPVQSLPSPAIQRLNISSTFQRSQISNVFRKTCSGVNPAVGSLTDSKIELELPGSAAGAPGSAGKSSLDIWNSEEWSAGCFTIPTRRAQFYENQITMLNNLP